MYNSTTEANKRRHPSIHPSPPTHPCSTYEFIQLTHSPHPYSSSTHPLHSSHSLLHFCSSKRFIHEIRADFVVAGESEGGTGRRLLGRSSSLVAEREWRARQARRGNHHVACTSASFHRHPPALVLPALPYPPHPNPAFQLLSPLIYLPIYPLSRASEVACPPTFARPTPQPHINRIIPELAPLCALL